MIKILLNSKVKIKRLRWQIEDLKQRMKDSDPAHKKSYEEAIRRRNMAIEWLQKQPGNPSWKKVRKMFGFKYYL